MRILLLNGPNLNLLGTRRPDIYGTTTLGDVESMFRTWAGDLDIESVETFQSNHEGALIDRIHAARGTIDGIVFNPGAFTHTSYALHDAIESVEIPTVEVHISNVEERESWRRVSVVRPACVHTVYGRGIDGYRWGLLHLINRSAMPSERLVTGSEPDQFADLRLPGDATAPLLVLVHGGFWRHMWTRDITESIAVDATRRGLASLNVEYRRVGTGGGGLATVNDIVAAIHAGLGHPDVDDERWAIAGHSAGGQLAIAAAKAMTDAGRPPVLVATLGGVADLAQAMADGTGDGAATAYVGAGSVDELSPVEMAPIGAPLLVAHGDADDRVPVLHAELLAAALEGAGETPTLQIRRDGGHFEYLDPTEPAWVDVADAMVTALFA